MFITLSYYPTQKTFSIKAEAITHIEAEDKGTAIVRMGNTSVHVFENRNQILKMIETKKQSLKGETNGNKKESIQK